MVPRQSFINKIRSLDYTYKSQQKRTYLWRKIGGTHYISGPRVELFEDEFVKSALRQAGVSEQDIQSFLSDAKA